MKNFYCTLDTETYGGAATPKGIYHLAGIIHDRNANPICAFNYVISEHYDEIQQDEYAKRNFDLYETMVKTGVATMIPTEAEAIAAVNSLCNWYSVNTMLAFNTGFDFCKTVCRDLLEGREFIDLFLMACETLAIRKKYGDFCREHGFKSKSGKSVATSAEAFYAYLTDNADYIEEHTALEDARIEMEIFRACIRSHKAFTKNCHFYDFPGKWILVPKWNTKKVEKI